MKSQRLHLEVGGSRKAICGLRTEAVTHVPPSVTCRACIRVAAQRTGFIVGPGAKT